MVTEEKARTLHRKISNFLRQSQFASDYLYDAAEHALLARSFTSTPDEDVDVDDVTLFLDAATRAISLAGQDFARRCTEGATLIVENNGPTWTARHRLLHMRTLETSAELAILNHDAKLADAKLMELGGLSLSEADQIQMAIPRVRILLASTAFEEAARLVTDTLSQHGLTKKARRPTVQQIQFRLKTLDEHSPALDDKRHAALSLIANAGISIWTCHPALVRDFSDLALSLIMEVGTPKMFTASLLALCALHQRDTDIRRLLVEASRQHTSSDKKCSAIAMIGLTALSHVSGRLIVENATVALEEMDKVINEAYEANDAVGFHDLAACE